MNIQELKLVICYDNGHEKTLIYRGNENVIIRSSVDETEQNVLVSRNILEDFVSLIKGF